ncbi:MAG: AraC family transcriptional regulator [Polyangiaceae bacterium]|nr:AraC family transcriptional regulator [Polyangiaceae bacterium]
MRGGWDESFALPALYVRHIAAQLRAMGADVERWLRQSGLDERRLSDPGFSLRHATFHRLVVDSLAVSGEPAMGLLVGRRLTASAHGMVGYAAMSSATVRQALEVFERFARLRISLVSVSHEIRRGEVRVRFCETRPLGDLRRPLQEAVIVTVKDVLDAVSMGACKVTRVSFPFGDPGYPELARDVLRAEVRYGQRWAGFVVPLSGFDAPLKLADADAHREAAAICQRELERLVADEGAAARVRRLLLERQGGFPSLKLAARSLHLTPRTLHRRLCDEGTSFQVLLDEVRRALAVEQLTSGRVGVEELAYSLGYSDAANFRRAFRRWEGVPPSEYRAAQEASKIASEPGEAREADAGIPNVFRGGRPTHRPVQPRDRTPLQRAPAASSTSRAAARPKRSASSIDE